MSNSEHTPVVAAASGPRGVQLRSNFRRSAQGREIVIVLGMHRSGTSLLSNILHLLGVDMVDQPTHASKSNETGFWERPDIVALQDDILYALGAPVGSPMHAVPLKAGWWRNPEIRDLKKRLHDLMAEHLDHVRRPWGFKDPRTCRLLPLWGEILEELDVSPRFVWAVRHPAEAAVSMSLKNPQARPMPVAQSEVMWLAYNYDILRHAGRHWPIIVPYESWFEDPAGLAKELGHELDVQWRGSDHELESALSELINAEKRHHWVTQGKLRSGLPLSNDVYGAILALRGGADEAFDERTAVALQSVLAAVQPFAAEARDLRPLKEDLQRLTKDAEQLQVSQAEAEAQVLTLRGEIAVLRKVLAEAEAWNASLQATLSNSAEEAAAERTRLLDDLAATAGELAAAQAKLGESERQLVEAQASHHTSTRHLTLLGGERDGLRAELASLAAARDGLQRALQKMQAQRDELQAERVAAETTAAEQHQANAALLTGIETLKAEVASISTSRSSAKKAEMALRQELAATVESANADRGRLQSALSIAEGRFKDAIAERDGLLDDKEQSSHKIEAVRQQLLAAAVIESELTKKTNGFLAEIDRLRAETIGIEAARDEQLHLAAQFRDELEAMGQRLEALTNTAREDQEALGRELESAISGRAELEQRLTEAGAGREALEQRLAEAAAEREALRQQLHSEATAQQMLLSEAASASERWQEHHDAARRERDGLLADITLLRQEQAILEEKRGATEAAQALAAQDMQSHTEQQRDALAAAAQERDGLRAAMDLELAKHQGEIGRLRGKLAEGAAAEAVAREAARAVAAGMGNMKAEMAGLRAALRSERERLAANPLAKPTADGEKRAAV